MLGMRSCEHTRRQRESPFEARAQNPLGQFLDKTKKNRLKRSPGTGQNSCLCEELAGHTAGKTERYQLPPTIAPCKDLRAVWASREHAGHVARRHSRAHSNPFRRPLISAASPRAAAAAAAAATAATSASASYTRKTPFQPAPARGCRRCLRVVFGCRCRRRFSSSYRCRRRWIFRRSGSSSWRETPLHGGRRIEQDLSVPTRHAKRGWDRGGRGQGPRSRW